MARPIDANLLKKRLDDMEVRGGHKYYREGMDVALHEFMPALIDEQPTVDAVEVVRCENCVHSASEGWFCRGAGLVPFHKTFPTSYCYEGERRADG